MKLSVFNVWLHTCIVLFCQARTFYVKEGDPFLCETELNKVFFTSIRWSLTTFNGTTINIADCDESYNCQVNNNLTNFQALLRVKDYNSYYRSADMSITLNMERLTKDMQHLRCLSGFYQQALTESVVCSFSFGVEPNDHSFPLKLVIPFAVGIPILAIIACSCRKYIRLKRTRTGRSHSHTLNNRDSIFTVPVPSHQTANKVITNPNTVHRPNSRPITSNNPSRHTKSSRKKTLRPAHTSSNLNQRGLVVNNSNTASTPGSIPSSSNTSCHHTPTRLDAPVCPVQRTSNLNQRDRRTSMTVPDHDPPSYSSLYPGRQTTSQYHVQLDLSITHTHAALHNVCPTCQSTVPAK